ncbi:MAG: glycosyltransferase, partial [Chryseobacterium sp.]|nr:glycosyltransferase [Chryseobacterium sp.]
KNKLIKINNPVDINFIEEKLAESERSVEFSHQHKNVVAIGNLSARKGFDNLLKVFTRLKNQNILLHILGDGKDKEMLLQMKEILGLDHVIFHGKKSNPYQYLKFADLFILSSRYEGFPNVLLEAGTCGVYSLANNCPGGIDEIIIDQINGEISNIESYDDFAEKIKHAVHRNNDKENIKASIKSRFSKEIILKKYEDLLWNI